MSLQNNIYEKIIFLQLLRKTILRFSCHLMTTYIFNFVNSEAEYFSDTFSIHYSRTLNEY